MSTSTTDNDDVSALKLDLFHQPEVDIPALIPNNTLSPHHHAHAGAESRSFAESENDDIHSSMHGLPLRIPKKERHEIEPELLEHKLSVNSIDSKIHSLLCPIELVLDAKNYTAPLIPAKYDPEIFCGFHNVQSNSFIATTPKITGNPRKRKLDSSGNRSAKKRKKASSNSQPQAQSEQHAKKHSHAQSQPAHAQQPSHAHAHGHHSQHERYVHDMPEDEFFGYQPDLNVNSRPKRQRKKVSYKEPDANAPVPVNYVKGKSPKAAKAKSPAKTHSTAHKQPDVVMHKIERFVEMKWVQCDKCLKWRRIPASISDKELEGEWECKMNKWDLQRNSCVADEEEYDLAEEQTVEVTNGTNNEQQQQKRLDFYAELAEFYASHEMKDKKLDVRQLEETTIGDKTVDFCQLYLEITKRGGYYHCIQAKLFAEVFASLECFQADCADIANHMLQSIYFQYLLDYERKHYQGSKESSNQPFIVNEVIPKKTHGLHSNF